MWVGEQGERYLNEIAQEGARDKTQDAEEERPEIERHTGMWHRPSVTAQGQIQDFCLPKTHRCDCVRSRAWLKL